MMLAQDASACPPPLRPQSSLSLNQSFVMPHPAQLDHRRLCKIASRCRCTRAMCLTTTVRTTDGGSLHLTLVQLLCLLIKQVQRYMYHSWTTSPPILLKSTVGVWKSNSSRAIRTCRIFWELACYMVPRKALSQLHPRQRYFLSYRTACRLCNLFGCQDQSLVQDSHHTDQYQRLIFLLLSSPPNPIMFLLFLHHQHRHRLHQCQKPQSNVPHFQFRSS